MNLKTILQLESKIEEFVSHWHVDMSTPIDILEQMCLQYLLHLGKVKEQAIAQQEAQKKAQKEAEKSVEDQACSADCSSSPKVEEIQPQENHE